MKNLLKNIVFILFAMGLSFLAVCAGSSPNNTAAAGTAVGGTAARQAENSGYKTLDQAIKEAAERIDKQIAAGTKIAILNFNSTSDQFSIYVIDELTANFLDTRKLIVIDRKEIDLIRGELKFQLSGEVSDESIQELGKILGAQTIVSGSLMEIGDTYRIVIRALSVQTATVEVQYRTDIANDNRVRALLATGKTANIGNASLSKETAAPAENQPGPAAQTKTGTVIDFMTTGARSGTAAVSGKAGGSLLCIQSSYTPYSVPVGWNKVGSFEVGTPTDKTYMTTVSKREASGEKYSVPINGGNVSVTTLISFADIWDYEVFHYQIHENSQRNISINSNNNGKPTIFIVAVMYAWPSTRVTMTPAKGVTVFDDPAGSSGFRAVVQFLVQEDTGGTKNINVSDYSRGDGRTLVVGLYLK